MKIAVAATGNSINAAVDAHTGRARCFILYDTEEEDFEVYDNWRIMECRHWAGSRTAATLTEIGADVVILRNIGPCAFRTLSDARIDLFLAPDESRVVDAIRRFREGELPAVSAPNCPGHLHLR